MTCKIVLRHSPKERLFRLFRVMWNHGTVGDGNGYSAKFTVAFVRKLFAWKCEWDGWCVHVAGVRFHFRKSYGGIFV